MIFYLDAHQRYQSYNQTFLEWFGVKPEQVLGKTVEEFLGPAAYLKVQPRLAIAYGGQQETYEMKAPSRMGKDNWLSIVYTPHKAQDGTVLGVIVLSTDVSHSKQMEIALRNSETRFKDIINEAPVATCLLTGRDKVITIANEIMLGY